MRRSTLFQPVVDISETSSDIVVSAHFSNIELNDMNLNVTEDSVTLSAYVWDGFEDVMMTRTIPLPTSIRAEAVDAGIQNGIVEIRLPKTEKVSRHRTNVGQEQGNQ